MDIQMGGHRALFEEGKAVLFFWTGTGMRYESPAFLHSDVLLAALSWTFSCSRPFVGRFLLGLLGKPWYLLASRPAPSLRLMTCLNSVLLSIGTCAIASTDVS